LDARLAIAGQHLASDQQVRSAQSDVRSVASPCPRIVRAVDARVALASSAEDEAPHGQQILGSDVHVEGISARVAELHVMDPQGPIDGHRPGSPDGQVARDAHDRIGLDSHDARHDQAAGQIAIAEDHFGGRCERDRRA
jgi:hypothetical protein